jgi:hypothetical protein
MSKLVIENKSSKRMDNNKNQLEEWSEIDCDSISFDDLESKLKSELKDQLDELNGLELDHEKIGSPDSIGDTVMNVVWDQFVNQVGVIAGEDFIRENRGLTLDLRESSHIQTTENFANGNIATHNDKIDYKQRYDDWQSNFEHDNNGNVLTHQTRVGREEATLKSGARKPFDAVRPTGSVERGTDMDHTVPAGEILRDAAANAHMTREEQIRFANSDANLNEMDASHNRSKGDLSMNEWLDNPNKRGQKPSEIFDIDEKQDKKYRAKDEEARAEYENQKIEAEKRSIAFGKQSRKEEAFRIGGKALRAVLMELLASLIRDIICHFIKWIRSGEKKLKTFIASLKDAITSFLSNIKERILNAGNMLLTTVATAILGPIVGVIKKAWIFFRQGYSSVKQAIKFLKDPANKDMPFGIKMMHVGKMIIAALTAGGAIVLGEVIEKGLMSIPVFTFQIPFLGSLASLLGMFFGALASGIVGALALNLIDRLISKKMKELNEDQQMTKRNDILSTQSKLLMSVSEHNESARDQLLSNIQSRRHDAAIAIESSLKQIVSNSQEINTQLLQGAKNNPNCSDNDDTLDDIFDDLSKM